MTQPEALRLAAALDAYWGAESGHDRERQAAAELRRQHALLQEWEAKAATWLASPEAAQRLDGYRELSQRANRAEAQRDALLDACKGLLNLFEQHEDRARIKSPVGDYARAAIKAVEEK